VGGDVRCTHNSLVDVLDGTVHFSGGQARNIHHHVGVVFTGTFWCCVVDTRDGTLRTADSFVVESVQLTRLAAATTHINLPSLVQSDVVLAGHTPVVSPTQPTIAFCSIF
jgi:hypothetical protein